ncbi:CDP-glycerol glycerophosphotransferase family protein [Gracilibacillus sp. Marseille-QA3620]
MTKLSVIVPIYNVESYLEECLDSLANQSLNGIEVIMVNDGSTDSSGEIMHEYAKRYSNFYAYDKENGGLGQARNFGVPFASGEYIAFVDSDDYLPEDAYKKLYNTIKETGSDIAIGNVIRYNSTKQFPSVLHKRVFKDTVLKAHISRNPELIYDTTAWNKVFKTSFWKENNFQFPEGMLYEDLPVTIPAHFKAKSVDIISDVVYHWRARDVGDQSITQQRTNLVNLTDRLKAIRMVDEHFRKNNIDESLKIDKDFKNLEIDLLVYLNQLDSADDEYIDVYLKEVSSYLKGVSKLALQKLNAIDRMKYYFVEKQDKEKLLELLHFQKYQLRYKKIIKEGTNYYGDYPYKEIVPKELLLLNDELLVKKKIESVQWQGSVLNIKGYAYIKDIDIKKAKDIQLKAFFVNEMTGEEVEIRHIKQQRRPDITFRFGVDIASKLPLKRLYDYKWSGWELKVDLAQEEIINMGIGKFKIVLDITANGINRRFTIGEPVSGRVSKPKFRIFKKDIFFVKYNAAWDLIITKEDLITRMDKVEVSDGQLIVHGETKLPLEGSLICLRNYDIRKDIKGSIRGVEKTSKGTTKFLANIPISDLKKSSSRGNWFGHIYYNNEFTPLTTDINLLGKKISFGSNELNISHSPAANLQLMVTQHTVNVKKLELNEEMLKLDLKVSTGYISKEKKQTISVLMVNNKLRREVYFDTYVSKEQHDEVIVSCEIMVDEAFQNLDMGIWSIYLSVLDNRGTVLQKDIIYYDIENIDNQKRLYKETNFKFYRKKKDNSLSLRVEKEWGWIERGPRRQEVIRKVVYPLMRIFTPLKRKTIVFESYWGKSFDCNPRALYEYIDENLKDYETVWFLRDENTAITGGGKKIRVNSFSYYYYLARAKYFVNNVNFPDFYKKRKNAVELQTMHGTPLKTLGLDVPGDVDTEPKRSRFLERCERWDYLTVPSAYVEDISKRAFNFDKKVMRYGYPRNDKLFTGNNEENIQELKRNLNIPLDKKVIFYAPTWRIKNWFKVEMDLEKMYRELKGEYVILFKFHHFVAKSVTLPKYPGFVYNLSNYDDIRDLYLISDVLITDYSSVMFDFAILSKPQILFTYDLEKYRDNLRGMYLNILEEAPGPITKDTDELLKAIKNVDHSHNSIRMNQFRQKYCSYDDGNASKRIAEQFLGISKNKVIKYQQKSSMIEEDIEKVN